MENEHSTAVQIEDSLYFLSKRSASVIRANRLYRESLQSDLYTCNQKQLMLYERPIINGYSAFA